MPRDVPQCAHLPDYLAGSAASRLAVMVSILTPSHPTTEHRNMTPESSEKIEKKNYKTTLNLPQTAFAMEAKLVQNEP